MQKHTFSKEATPGSGYENAIKEIKDAILVSQYAAARSVNEKQLTLYFAIGKYISMNSRKGFWGTDAINVISERLQKEMPGLRGFSARNLHYMRDFYEVWSNSPNASGEIEENANQVIKIENVQNIILQPRLQIFNGLSPDAFLSIGFSLHIIIISKINDIDERIYYVNKAASGIVNSKLLIICP